VGDNHYNTRSGKEAIMATPLFSFFEQHNPVRALQWRWNRACWLAKRYRYAPRCQDDPQTLQAFRFIRAMNAYRTAASRNQARKDFPDHAAAHAIYRTDNRTRLAVECRVLARESTEEIAHELSLPVSVVAAYEDVFFDVRSRLAARDWIILRALGRPYVNIKGEPNVGAIARLFSFMGGPLIVREVLPRLLDGSLLSSLPLDLSTPSGALTLQLRMAVEALTMPTDGKTAIQLFRALIFLQPFMEPETNVLDWKGVPAATVSDLPADFFQKVAESTVPAVNAPAMLPQIREVA
jgi:hypothetical protein